MGRERTVKDAAEKLPVEARKAFLSLWEANGSMDLYDGDLAMYFSIIQQSLEEKERTISKAIEKTEEINIVLQEIMEKYKQIINHHK